MMQQGEGVNWVSVISFLQKEHSKASFQEQEWLLERQAFQDKISRLQAELNCSRTMLRDLINRVRLLQIALIEFKCVKRPGKQGGNFVDKNGAEYSNLVEKYSLESQLQSETDEYFIEKVLSQIGINCSQIGIHNSSIEHQPKKSFFSHEISYKAKQPTFNLQQASKTTAHLDSIRGLFKQPDSDVLITISEDCLVKLWSFADLTQPSQHLEPSRTYRQHTGPLFTIDGGCSPFNPEECIFFTGGSEGYIKYWKMNRRNPSLSGRALGFINNSSKDDDREQGGAIWSLSLNNNMLLSSSSDSHLRLFRVEEGLDNEEQFFIKSYRQKEYKPTSIIWLSDQTFIHGCSNAPRAQLWDVNGRLSQVFPYQIGPEKEPSNCQINSISYFKHSKALTFGCEDGFLRLFAANAPHLIKKIQLDGPANCLSILNDWQLVCGTDNGSLSIWDLRTYMMTGKVVGCHQNKYDEGLLCLAVGCSEGSQMRILSGGADGIVKTYR